MPDGAAKGVLVTGAGKRIGRHIAQAFAADGWRVALHAHSSIGDAEALKAELASSFGTEAVVLAADLSDEGQCRSLVSQAVEALGPLDVVVNNAAIYPYDDVRSLSWATAQAAYAVNCLAPVTLACAFAEHLRERGAKGAVVNLIDNKVSHPDGRFLSYEMSKSTIAAETLGLARALAPDVRVNGVAPGLTLISGRMSETSFRAVHADTPLGAGAEPGDVAEACLFLAKADKITGQILTVDGGGHLRGAHDGFYASLPPETTGEGG